jgi:hypothetical protein
MTYEDWKLKLIKLILDEDLGDNSSFLKIQEISCVIQDDCEYPESYKNGETPEDVWQDELDAMNDSR